MKKKKILVILTILALAFALIGCSDTEDKVKDEVNNVKSEAKVLLEDAETFLSAKKDLLGAVEEKLIEELHNAEKVVVVDVQNAKDYSAYLKDNVIGKIDELKAKAETFEADRPLKEEAKAEYNAILDEVKASAEKVIAAVESGEQEKFESAKADFEAVKEKLINFEETVKNKAAK